MKMLNLLGATAKLITFYCVALSLTHSNDSATVFNACSVGILAFVVDYICSQFIIFKQRKLDTVESTERSLLRLIRRCIVDCQPVNEDSINASLEASKKVEQLYYEINGQHRPATGIAVSSAKN